MHFCSDKLFYEGFVVIYDEGYHKSIYVSTIIPHDTETDEPFYSPSKFVKDSWMLILIKALAKYFGSYEKLRTASLNSLCMVMFGSYPVEICDEFRTKYEIAASEQAIEDKDLYKLFQDIKLIIQ